MINPLVQSFTTKSDGIMDVIALNTTIFNKADVLPSFWNLSSFLSLSTIDVGTYNYTSVIASRSPNAVCW